MLWSSSLTGAVKRSRAGYEVWRAVDGVCFSFNSLTVYVRELELNRESSCMRDESWAFLFIENLTWCGSLSCSECSLLSAAGLYNEHHLSHQHALFLNFITYLKYAPKPNMLHTCQHFVIRGERTFRASQTCAVCLGLMGTAVARQYASFASALISQASSTWPFFIKASLVLKQSHDKEACLYMTANISQVSRMQSNYFTAVFHLLQRQQSFPCLYIIRKGIKAAVILNFLPNLSLYQ